MSCLDVCNDNDGNVVDFGEVSFVFNCLSKSREVTVFGRDVEKSIATLYKSCFDLYDLSNPFDSINLADVVSPVSYFDDVGLNVR